MKNRHEIRRYLRYFYILTVILHNRDVRPHIIFSLVVLLRKTPVQGFHLVSGKESVSLARCTFLRRSYMMEMSSFGLGLKILGL